MKTTERYTGTVEHDGVPAHDCRRITDITRKTSLTFCSRCGDWFGNFDGMKKTSQDQCQEPEEYEDEDTYDDRMNQKEQCRNPNHALADGSPHLHEIGPSCMTYRPKSKQPKPRKRKKAKRASRF